MTRKRIEGTQFSSWEDVDNALRQIGEIDRDIRLLENAQNEIIDGIKKQTKENAAPLLERKTSLELATKEYCESNRAEFAKVKSKALTFGSVGFRLSTKILIKRVADTIQALKDLQLTSCLRIKEEIDKEAMKNLSTDTLAEVGASLKTDNTFGYEINLEQIREAA